MDLIVLVHDSFSPGNHAIPSEERLRGLRRYPILKETGRPLTSTDDARRPTTQAGYV